MIVLLCASKRLVLLLEIAEKAITELRQNVPLTSHKSTVRILRYSTLQNTYAFFFILFHSLARHEKSILIIYYLLP